MSISQSLNEQAISTIIFPSPFFNLKVCHTSCQPIRTLFRDKIIHDKCHLCDQKQTLNHLFVSCPDVQIFWRSFSRWWNVKNDDFIVLNDETIIYGFTNGFSQQLGLNLCLTITKPSIVLQGMEKIISSKPSSHTLKLSKLPIETSQCKSQINL